MPNADHLEFLKTRFRVDVDDVDLDPDDSSGLLWSDDDILEYINVAHAEFIHDTLYRRGVIEVPVIAGDPVATLPDNVIETRHAHATLVSTGQEIREINYDTSHPVEDYGSTVNVNAFASDESGPPVCYTLDYESNTIRLAPVPETDDLLRISVYLEADELCRWTDRLHLRRMRHVRMLLAGMKREAYLKQDADVYDREQAGRWDAIFRRNVNQVYGEIKRRNEDVRPMRYGGL